MKWFNNLKINVKLILCFFLLTLFTGIVGFVGINNMGAINTRAEKMYQENFIPAQNLASIQRNLILVRANYLLILYERDMTKFQERSDEIDALAQNTNQVLDEYEISIHNEQEQAIFDDIKKYLLTYRAIRKEHMEFIKAGNFAEAEAKISDFTKAREDLDNTINKLIDYNKTYAKEQSELNSRDFASKSIITLAIIAIGTLLAITLGFIIASIISKPINKLLSAANKIADGDLDVVIDVHSKDEIGNLASSFQKMADNLNEVMSNINMAAEQVASGSKQVSDSSMTLSQGATEQASSIQQLTAALEEIASQTNQNADSANQANELAEITKRNALQGNNQMNDMLKAMDDINNSSNSISKIIKVIDEIAFQTNILALNAAVEAARAGQHGKGFAVVAEEVRNLAARSANAAKETTEMIESSIKKVEGGTTIARHTADALNHIVDDIARMANLVGSIAAASNEQAIGISQLNQGVMQVSEVVQTNSATSEESAAASEELSSQAEMLKDQVARFNLGRHQKVASLHSNMDALVRDDIRNLDFRSEYNNHNRADMTANVQRLTGEKAIKRIILNDNEFGKY
jgi:methyl-accepting chemotaxis protein